MVVELSLPCVASERGLLSQHVRGVRGEHKDEFLNLAVLLYLASKVLVLDLTIEYGHDSPRKLVRIASLKG